MRARGVSYSTGFVLRNVNSRPSFDPSIVQRELQIIRDDLHCTAVRIMGGDAQRIEVATQFAAELGLEVWVSPYPLELDELDSLKLIVDCARSAERLRKSGVPVVLVAGAELSLMNPGFLPGESLDERVSFLQRPGEASRAVPQASDRVNQFLRTVVAAVRDVFAGQLTYASTPLENVDWAPFDFISVDLYRSAGIADQFVAGVRRLAGMPKPVAITEFGAATYKGAADLGALGLQIVEYDETTGWPVRLKKRVERDEHGQAAHVLELLRLFDEQGIDSAFVFTFALYDFPHHPDADPVEDLDLASYGLVRPLVDRASTTHPDMPWEAKEAFNALAAYYGRL